MKQRIKRTSLRKSLLTFGTLAAAAPLLPGAQHAAPASGIVPESASREVLNQTADQGGIRWAGLDMYPHVAGTVLFDDNLFISPTNRVGAVELTLTPGLMVTAGDVSTYFAGPITLPQLRNLLSHSLYEDTAKPQRFLAVDYTPDLNMFVDERDCDNVDHFAGLTAGYAFSRLSLSLDLDFRREDVKDPLVGDRVTVCEYDTRIGSRYELTDRSSVEINGNFIGLNYEDPRYQDYQEFRNDDWVNHKLTDKLSAGVGAAFGLVLPENSPNQVYQQFMGRGVYQLSGKLHFKADAGVEVREYDADHENTLDPTFAVAGIYQPWPNTTLTLEGFRRERPSPYGNANYTTYGLAAGVRQLLWNRVYGGITGGYNNIDYTALDKSAGSIHSDDFYFVRVNLDYQVNPHWTAGLFYSFTKDDATPWVYSYENNIVGGRVTLKF